nr:hypothetical protein [Tanacetum cinerariifolium]
GGGFVGGSGSGGDGWKRGEVGLIMVAGKTGWDEQSELVEGKEKSAGEEMIQERTKKKKVEYDKETAKLQQLMEIIPGKEEVAIDDLPLAVKSPKIVD